MPVSSPISSGDQVLATQYNSLRTDVLNPTTGHPHDGVNGKGGAGSGLDADLLDGVQESGYARYLTGTFAAMPAAGTVGRTYYASDFGVFFFDDGTEWLVDRVLKQKAEYLFEDFILMAIQDGPVEIAQGRVDWQAHFVGSGAWRDRDGTPSVFGLHTSTTNASRSSVLVRKSGMEHYAVAAAGVPAILTWRAATVTATRTYERVYLGLMPVGFPGVWGEPSNGVYFRKIDTGTEQDWYAVTRSSVTGLETATLVTGGKNTSMHFFKAVIVNTTTVKFYFDGALVATHTANVPTTGLAIASFIDNTEAANKIFDHDMVEWVAKRV